MYKKINFKVLNEIDKYFYEYEKSFKISKVKRYFILLPVILNCIVWLFNIHQLGISDLLINAVSLMFFYQFIFSFSQLIRLVFGFIKKKKIEQEQLKEKAINQLLKSVDIDNKWINILKELKYESFNINQEIFYIEAAIEKVLNIDSEFCMSIEVYKKILPLITMENIKDVNYEIIQYIEAGEINSFYKQAYMIEADMILDYKHDKSHVSVVQGGHNNTSVSTSISSYSHYKGMAVKII